MMPVRSRTVEQWLCWRLILFPGKGRFGPEPTAERNLDDT